MNAIAESGAVVSCVCGESLPHVCSPMPAYRCLRCGAEAILVRLCWPDGVMRSDGSDVWFTCERHHTGTLIGPAGLIR